jgi:phospholipase/lecithinase/hemolysin
MKPWSRALLALALWLPLNAQALVFDNIFVFGDSLSDNGNTFAVTSAAQPNPFGIPVIPPSPPYFGGRSSNGPVAVEYLASQLGIGLRDFAQAGATTGIGNTNDGGTVTTTGALGLQGVSAQLAQYLNSNPVDPNALYVVWAGPNDFLAGFADPNFDPAAAVSAAVINLANAVASLASLGAEDIFVPNMANLGVTPRLMSLGAAAGGELLTRAFNTALAMTLAGLEAAFPATDFIAFDTFSAFNEVLANPGAFGFSNVTDPCLTLDPFSLCSADPNVQNQFFFWDDLHPSTPVHLILASQFNAAVPEPQSLALFVAGFAALLLLLGRSAFRRDIGAGFRG